MRRRSAPMLLLASFLGQVISFDRGLNLPPTQGLTGDGAYFPGVYTYEYRPPDVSRALPRAGFDSLRLGINVETAQDPNVMYLLRQYVDAAEGRSIICMFDTSTAPGLAEPRPGRILNVAAHTEAWRKVHTVFGSYGKKVLYEIFNEPWGYKNDVHGYMADMMAVVSAAELPVERVMLAGLGYSFDIQSVAKAGWPGYFAYHIYPWYLPAGSNNADDFKAQVLRDLEGIGSRVFLTEFGSGLPGLKVNTWELDDNRSVVRHVDNSTMTSDWQAERPDKVEVICKGMPRNAWCQRQLRRQKKSLLQHGSATSRAAARGPDQKLTEDYLGGLRDALLQLRRQGQGVQGVHHWHGWHNGDTYDFWEAQNARSSRLIQLFMADVAQAVTGTFTDPWQVEDFATDEQLVHMLLLRKLGPVPTAPCSEECGTCQTGGKHSIGSKMLMGSGKCSHFCSKPFDGVRYCGVGPDYEGPEHLDCRGCSGPATCAALPCWAEAADGGAQPVFLQRNNFLSPG